MLTCILEPHPFTHSLPSTLFPACLALQSVYPIENASLLPSMTDARTPYETDKTTFTIPVIQINGENLEVNETTEEYVSFIGLNDSQEHTAFT